MAPEATGGAERRLEMKWGQSCRALKAVLRDFGFSSAENGSQLVL